MKRTLTSLMVLLLGAGLAVAQDATPVDAPAAPAAPAAAPEAAAPATTTTGDVRGTYTPATASNGIVRTVMGILLPAIAVGPNATRVGALGVTQA